MLSTKKEANRGPSWRVKGQRFTSKLLIKDLESFVRRSIFFFFFGDEDDTQQKQKKKTMEEGVSRKGTDDNGGGRDSETGQKEEGEEDEKEEEEEAAGGKVASATQPEESSSKERRLIEATQLLRSATESLNFKLYSLTSPAYASIASFELPSVGEDLPATSSLGDETQLSLDRCNSSNTSDRLTTTTTAPLAANNTESERLKEQEKQEPQRRTTSECKPIALSEDLANEYEERGEDKGMPTSIEAVTSMKAVVSPNSNESAVGISSFLQSSGEAKYKASNATRTPNLLIGHSRKTTSSTALGSSIPMSLPSPLPTLEGGGASSDEEKIEDKQSPLSPCISPPLSPSSSFIQYPTTTKVFRLKKEGRRKATHVELALSTATMTPLSPATVDDFIEMLKRHQINYEQLSILETCLASPSFLNSFVLRDGSYAIINFLARIYDKPR